MKTSPRSMRLAGILAEKIPPLLQQFFSPEEIGFVTVTAVEVSGDLGVGDVFIRSIGNRKEVAPMLNKKAPLLVRELLKEVKLRRAIELRFKPDKSVEIEHIFQK